jgi:hypothetical protein
MPSSQVSSAQPSSGDTFHLGKSRCNIQCAVRNPHPPSSPIGFLSRLHCCLNLAACLLREAPEAVGVQEKSTSGGQEREARPRPSKRVSRAPASEGRAAGSIDGTWAVSATGRCVPPWQLTFLINNGVISGSGAAGQVSRGGSASGHVLVLALRFDFIGHFGGRQASGTFTGADGCPGTWSATKS